MLLKNIVLLLIFYVPSTLCIMFPEYTVYQIVSAVSWPAPLKLRKVFMNVGFQLNYQMPFTLSSFTNPTYIQTSRLLSDELSPDDSITDGTSEDNGLSTSLLSVRNATDNSTDISVNQKDEQNGKNNKRSIIEDIEHINYEKYGLPTGQDGSSVATMDISAGELYKTIEEYLNLFGYHETCLLKSVCQLARHPFYIGDDEHLLAEMLHLILTPSEHQAFKLTETYERERYETAEHIGNKGGDCHLIYDECSVSFLDSISYVTDDKIELI